MPAPRLRGKAPAKQVRSGSRPARQPPTKPATGRAPGFRIGAVEVAAGTRRRIALSVARLPTGNELPLDIEVVHGRRAGPVLFVSAAVHGDELNGVEVVRRVLARVDPATMKGTLLAVPIVNVFGFLNQSRYLPDRRDLNRSFPGSARGSLAAQLAHRFMEDVVAPATHGIDLHTASHHRTNLPQVRADLSHPETWRLAKAFGAPVMLHARIRDGSLRAAATERDTPVLLYEAGPPQRYDKDAIAVGERGVLRVMAALGMRRAGPGPGPSGGAPRPRTKAYGASTWVRAPRSGLLTLDVEPGHAVEAQQVVGVVRDAMGDKAVVVRAPVEGVVLGLARNPVVNRGDGILHLAEEHSRLTGPQDVASDGQPPK